MHIFIHAESKQIDCKRIQKYSVKFCSVWTNNITCPGGDVVVIILGVEVAILDVGW